jgi:hypothetical protein
MTVEREIEMPYPRGWEGEYKAKWRPAPSGAASSLV